MFQGGRSPCCSSYRLEPVLTPSQLQPATQTNYPGSQGLLGTLACLSFVACCVICHLRQREGPTHPPPRKFNWPLL